MRFRFGSRLFTSENELFDYIDRLVVEVDAGSGESAFRLSLLFSDYSGLVEEIPNIRERYNINENEMVNKAVPLLVKAAAHGCEESKSILQLLKKSQ